MSKFQSKRWFNAIRDAAKGDIEANILDVVDKVEEAHAYYLTAIDDAEKHATAFGELSTMLAEQPGLIFLFSGIHNDAMTSRKWLEQEHDACLSGKYKWITSDPEAKAEYGKLGATDAKNYAMADDTVCVLADLVRVLSNAQHGIEAAVDALTQRGFSLAKIADIRVSGGEEIWIAPVNK